MDLKGKKIAFLGDSITEGIGASADDKKYVEVFKQITDCDAINYGISGTRFAKQIRTSENPSFDRDFISRVPDMDEAVDAVVVFGGTNDFGHGDAPFGDLTDDTPDTFCGACDYLMKILIEKYPSKPIIFMTPLHRIGEEYLVNDIGIDRKALAEYVSVIRKKAQKYSIPLIDLFKMSGMQPNIKVQQEQYFADDVHPNDNGHKKIANIIKNFFENFVI